jgi:hypothetical protein
MSVMDVPMPATLILVDGQRAVDHPSSGRPRNNPYADNNAASSFKRLDTKCSRP